ncbi:MAG: TRAP transporter substrate-binding protein DctP [Chloroflexi bacterium]|nr:TRAP transporter substrate-binding protein DctP [Chloroflexota bacterium]
MNSINRRDFLKAAGFGAAATALTACGATPAATTESAGNITADMPEIDWQMATSWSAGLGILFGGAQKFADRVAALTDGKFKITPRAGGELAKATEVLDVVSSNAVQIGHTASYYYVGKSQVMGFGASLPFGLSASQQNAWLYSGGGLAALQEFYAKKFNVIQFPAGNTGAQMGGWFRKEIKSLDDMKGLKMRIPGLGAAVMTELGVQAQSLPGGEIFQALETGAIDAAEWVGPYDDEALGLNKAAGYYAFPGWWEPGTTLEVQVNLDEWNKLPAQYQNAIAVAAAESNLVMLADYEAANGDALKRLVDGGTKLMKYSDDILDAAREAAFKLYDKYASEDPDFKAIYEPWLAFRNGVQNWNFSNEFVMQEVLKKAAE